MKKIILSILILILTLNIATAFEIGTGFVDEEPPYNEAVPISEPIERTECIDGENNDYKGLIDANDFLCFHPLDNTEKCQLNLRLGNIHSFYTSPLPFYDYQCEKFSISGENHIAQPYLSFFNIVGTEINPYWLEKDNYLSIQKWPSTDLLIFDDGENLQAIITDLTLEEDRSVIREGAGLHIPYDISNPIFAVRPSKQAIERNSREEVTLPYHLEFLQTKFGWKTKTPVNVYVKFENFDIGEIVPEHEGRNGEFKSKVIEQLNNFFEDYSHINIIQIDEEIPSDASTVLIYNNKEFYNRLGDLNPLYIEENPNKVNEPDPWNNRLKTDRAYVFAGTFKPFAPYYSFDDLAKYFAQVGAHEIGHSFGLYDNWRGYSRSSIFLCRSEFHGKNWSGHIDGIQPGHSRK